MLSCALRSGITFKVRASEELESVVGLNDGAGMLKAIEYSFEDEYRNSGPQGCVSRIGVGGAEWVPKGWAVV